jgi:hypothetical protein
MKSFFQAPQGSPFQNLSFPERLSLLGSAFRGQAQPMQQAAQLGRQFQAAEAERAQRQELGRILSGQQTPAFLRPGGAEYDPQQYQQGILTQLGALGTPEAIDILSEQSLPSAKPSAVAGSALERIAGRIMDESAQQGEPIDFVTALSLAKSGLGQGLTFKEGEIMPIAGALPVRQQLAQAREAGVQEAKTKFEPTRAAEKKKAEKEAELRVQRIAAFPKLDVAYQNKVAKSVNAIELIDEILPRVNILTAGFLTPAIDFRGSPAFNLKKDIDSILAFLGFDELQTMRDFSPTGGALGQVAVRELELLQGAKANIENSQSPEQLRRNLNRLKRILTEDRKRLDTAYNKEASFVSKQAPQFVVPQYTGEEQVALPQYTVEEALAEEKRREEARRKSRGLQ